MSEKTAVVGGALLAISLIANVFAWQTMGGLREIAGLACDAGIASSGECSRYGFN
jgi:hypothetical protein